MRICNIYNSPSHYRETIYHEMDNAFNCDFLFGDRDYKVRTFDISKLKLLKRYIIKKFDKIDFQDYNYLWKKIINRKRLYNGTPIQKGCFVGWDNSARKGYNCMIVKNNTPANFKKNLELLIHNNRKDSTNDFLVINAWNEWSEGAYLEPDQKNHYKYLEALKDCKEGNKKDEEKDKHV